MKGRSFSGCLYSAEVNEDGTLAGKWGEWGEAYPLTLQLPEEIVKVLGRTCETDGKVIGTKSRPSDAGGSVTMFDYTASNVARALKGMVTTRAVSETTITAEAVTLGKFNEFSEIGTEDLGSVVVQDETDATTYTVGVDYKINETLGLIAPLSGGAIAEDATVHVSATGAANTDQRVTIGAGSSKKLAIKGKMIDDYDGSVHKIFLRKVRVVSSSGATLVSDPGTEREQLDFELTPEIPTNQSDYGHIDGLPI